MKLKKEIASLETKKAQHERKRADATQRRNQLEIRRQSVWVKMADGDESARKELRALDGQRQDLLEDEQALGAAIADSTAKLTEAQIALRRAKDAEAVASLEAEIANFGVLDRELQAALRTVAEKSRALIQKVDVVGQRLTERDEKKYGKLAPDLAQQIRRSIFFHFEEMNKPNAVPRPTFSDATAPGMRRIVAELRYELAGRTMQPGRGEKVYRVLVACPGAANVDARPGDIVALPPDDPLTLQLVKSGTIELVDATDEAA